MNHSLYPPTAIFRGLGCRLSKLLAAAWTTSLTALQVGRHVKLNPLIVAFYISLPLPWQQQTLTITNEDQAVFFGNYFLLFHHQVLYIPPYVPEKDMIPLDIPLLEIKQATGRLSGFLVSKRLLENPGSGVVVPLGELLGLEPEGNLLLGVLDGVGAVADVAAHVLLVIS